ENHRPPLQDAAGRILPQYHWYLCLTEFLQETRSLSTAIADAIDGPKWDERAPLIQPKHPRERMKVTRRSFAEGRRVLKELCAARDVLDYVNELAAEVGSRKAEGEAE